MPEYIMPDNGSVVFLGTAPTSFNSLDTFTRSYVEAMFWTEVNEDSEPDMQECTFGHLAPETLEKIIGKCAKFQAMANAILEAADTDDSIKVNQGKRYGGYASAGHDFWLTRNGHGAGFWDGDWGKYGDDLDKIAKTFRGCDLYVGDDKKLYLM